MTGFRKIRTAFFLVVCMTLTLIIVPASAGSILAKPTNSTIYVNGAKVSFTAYNINGSNYFKLRDIAMALNTTNKKFSVDYNSTAKKISLETEQNYKPVGGELAPNSSMSNKSTVPTTASLFCNNVNLSYTAYNIDSANYFKLRDIMQVMDIGVNWDAAKNAISIDTGSQYIYENGILKGTKLPPLRVTGDWPVSAKTLQTVWARCYPLYTTYLGLPTKILTEGVTWEWDDSIVPDTVGYYPETNSFKMGPLPQHNNFSKENHEDYEPLYMQNMHETGHLFWQAGDQNLNMNFGQWIWEANSLIGETLYKLDYYNEWYNDPDYDLLAFLGQNAVNGVMSDGNKYGSGGRTVVDSSATKALVMLASVMSYDSGYDYIARVNDSRVAYYKETGTVSISRDEYGKLLDKASNGRTIDGMKPSEWLFSQPVANTDGNVGTYLTIVPSYPSIDKREIYRGILVIETALFRRAIDSHGDKKETCIKGTNVNLKLYDSAGKLLTQTTKPSPSEDHGTIDLPIPLSMAKGVYRIKADATVDGKSVTCNSYLIYMDSVIANNQIALVLLDQNGNIKTNAGSTLKIAGAKTLDMSAVSKGLVLMTANEGGNVSLACGEQRRTISKSYGSRIVPVRLN